jgi:hypothetical protein
MKGVFLALQYGPGSRQFEQFAATRPSRKPAVKLSEAIADAQLRAPSIGSRWIENDKRMHRVVQVCGFTASPDDRVPIKTVFMRAAGAQYGPITKVALRRFYKAFRKHP